MRLLDKIGLNVNRALIFIGGVFLVGMILLTCGNIFFRLVWVPISGTFELMGYSGAIVAAFALGYTQIKRGHIAVDVLTNTFSPKIKTMLSLINTFVCLVFFSVAAWQIAKLGANLQRTGEVTETLRIVYYPFVYGVGLGCSALSLVLLIDMIKIVIQVFFPDRFPINFPDRCPDREGRK
jgi:TRAP-type C4-dicarboxylate transport system permease small subunit